MFGSVIIDILKCMCVAKNNRAIMSANFMFAAVEKQYQTKLFRAFLWNSSVLAAHD